MKKTYELSIFYVAVVLMTMIFFPTSVFAGKGEKNNPLWQAADKSALPARPTAVPDNVPVYRLNRKLLDEIFAKAPREFTDAARETETILEIPTPDGGMMRFRIEESPMLSAEVAAQFPTWKQFVGQGIDDPTATASFDTNDLGFHAYVLSRRGTFVIDPYSLTDKTNYIVYYKGAVGDGNRDNFSCKISDHKSKGGADFFDFSAPQAFTNGTQLRTLKSAWSLTKEYTAFFGNNKTNAFAALTTTVSRMNTIFRRDLAATFTIVSDLRTVFDAANDGGFPDATDSNVASLSNRRNGTVLDTTYGQAAYDIGHVLSVTPSPNGLALSPSLCDNDPFPAPPASGGTTTKAQGFTGAPVPQGDGFDVDYVAHEIGHQFSMSHTFNNDVDGSCSTRAPDSAYEPASGITIMGYGGICAPRNLAANSIEYFNLRSFDQGLGYLQGANFPLPQPCGTVTATNNTPPTVTVAQANYTIPRLTPFTLTATATDPNGDALTYLWEEFDANRNGGTGSRPLIYPVPSPSPTPTPDNPPRNNTATDDDADGIVRPIFRAYNATASGSRTFPSLFYILNPAGNDQTANVNSVAGNQPSATYTGTLPFAPATGSTNGYVCAPTETCVRGERLPTINRTMKFRATVRDNRAGGGGVADAESNVTIAAGAGPFQVTTQNASPVSWQANSTQTVTWDVAGTTANGINAANVNILLSTDGGQTFPTTILANTPNDGTQSITVPNNPTTQARIKIEPVGNIFFDINNVNFTITAAAPTITVDPATLPNGTVGTAYNQTLSATGGTAPYSFAVSGGVLPFGLMLSSAGVISGTPTTAASFSFTVRATDANNNTGERTYLVTIAAAAPTITVDPATLPNGSTGVNYPSTTITATGGTAPYSFAVTAGALPNGLSLTTAGVLSGRPTTAGTFSFTVTATDANNNTGSRAYTVTIAQIFYEADVAPRPNGDGAIGDIDVTQIRRFLNKTDTANQTTTEYQRADSSPRATRGDGIINTADVIQARRVRNGTDARQIAGGPTTGSFALATVLNFVDPVEQRLLGEFLNPTGATGISVENASGSAGQTVTVNIRVNPGGQEAEFGFILNYDQTKLSNPVIGAGNAGSTVRSCNTGVAGQVNCSVGGFPVNSLGSSDPSIGEIAGTSNQILITVQFLVAANAPAGTTPLTITNSNASTDDPTLLTVAPTNGTVTIAGPTAASATVSGRVLTFSGRGIANARVTSTDQNGMTRTTRTNSFGYYRLADVEAGQTYIFNVSHKSYRFSPRVISVNENLSRVDFTPDN